MLGACTTMICLLDNLLWQWKGELDVRAVSVAVDLFTVGVYGGSIPRVDVLAMVLGNIAILSR